MGWHGHLSLDIHRDTTRDHARSVARSRHEGPLRVLAALYPEGPQICHQVLVHPPAGLVGGDVLDIDLHVGPRAHALLTTPGATRYYRACAGTSDMDRVAEAGCLERARDHTASQAVRAVVAADARLEWLPLETLVHPGAQGRNTLRFELAPGASMLGWDVLALGLPARGERLDRKSVV